MSLEDSQPERQIIRKNLRIQNDQQLEICLGEGSDGRFCVTPEDLFGRHLAVLGATGGGKSWSLAALIEACTPMRSKVLLLDASGEFHRLRNDTFHVAVGEPHHQHERSVSIPYFELTEGDLLSIFAPSGPSQAPKLRAAIQSLKLARLAPQLAADGTIHKAHRSKVEFDRARAKFARELDEPSAKFEVRYLPQQIQNECVDPQRSPSEPLTWGGPNGIDLAYCVPLVTRMQDMISAKNLAPLFDPGEEPSLFKALESFVEDPVQRVLRVSFRDVPFEHRSREILANAVARFVLERARNGAFERKPLVFVIDEAHQALARSANAANEFAPIDAFGLIAKEGRKYGLTLCLATQRPRDIPDDILSQIGSFVFHRMTNQLDLGVVERASSAVDQQLLGSIAGLAPGQGIFLSSAHVKPQLIRIKTPQYPPDSRGPDYQKYWAGN